MQRDRSGLKDVCGHQGSASLEIKIRNSGSDFDWFEHRIGPYLPSCDALGEPPITGRLSCSLEGSGKRLIFAIGNNINQRLLKIHDWFASVLRQLPCDGTFDQMQPLVRLKGCEDAFSYDLSSATDRWPLFILFETFQHLFDRSFASAVVNSTLATNMFLVPFVKRKGSQVCFVAGQPLGYYSSWPLFAFTHHLMVWLAAEQIFSGKRFDRYAVLGDDVLITDARLAPVYAQIVERLGVSISTTKLMHSIALARSIRLDFSFAFTSIAFK